MKLTKKQQYLKEYRAKHRAEARAASAIWRKQNPQRAAELQKRYRTANKKERRAHELERRYGKIRLEPPTCEAYGTPRVVMKTGLHADHNHATGIFRGWLCLRCNSALGYALDSRDRLQLLINYLDKAELLS